MGANRDDDLALLAESQGAPLFGTVRLVDFAGYEGKRHPSFYLPEAKSVIVVGIPTDDATPDLVWTRKDGRSYSFVNEVVGNIAMQVIGVLLRNGHQAVLTPYSGVYAKDAAALANLGVIGQNNLLIAPGHGPRLRLRTVVTDADVEMSRPRPEPVCHDCPRLCRSACPAGAFRGGRFSRAACEAHSRSLPRVAHLDVYSSCRECELACPAG